MRLAVAYRGRSFSVYDVDLSDDPARPERPAKAFVDSLPALSQHSMVRVIREHGDFGPLGNKQRSREEGDEIYAFKNRYGARVLWFYLPGRRTVLTHGFLKKGDKLPREEKDRALTIRAAVLREGL